MRAEGNLGEGGDVRAQRTSTGFLESSSLLLAGLELSDANVYEPIRAHLETAAHLCEVVVLNNPDLVNPDPTYVTP